MKQLDATSQSSLNSSNSNLVSDEVTHTILEEEEVGEYNLEDKESEDGRVNDDENVQNADITRSLDDCERNSDNHLIDSPVLEKAPLHSDTIFREVTVSGGE